MDQAEFEDKDILGNIKECSAIAGLGGYDLLFDTQFYQIPD
jgi:hypothetical protein